MKVPLRAWLLWLLLVMLVVGGAINHVLKLNERQRNVQMP